MICVPFGCQTGFISSSDVDVSWNGKRDAVSKKTVNRSLFPVRSLENTRLFPSGDQYGFVSAATLVVICRNPLPSTFITKISKFPV